MNNKKEQLHEQEMAKFEQLQYYKSKLNVGDEFANYKAICKQLEEEPRVSQNSRNAHFKEWNEYFKFEKKGHKFTITKIADTQLFEREDGRKGNADVYGEQLELIIMNILLRSESGYMTETRDDWTKLLGMYNYALNAIRKENSFERHEYSKNKNIPLAEVDEFIKATKQRTDKAFTRALERLNKKYLVSYKNVIEAKVEKLDRKKKKTYYNETFYEEEYIEIVREVLSKFNCKDEGVVYAIGNVNPQFLKNYRATLNTRLYEELGIVSHYKAVEIKFSKKEMQKYIDLFIKDTELLSEIKKLNGLMTNNFIDRLSKDKEQKVVELGVMSIIDDSKMIEEDEEEVEVFLLGNKAKEGDPETYFKNIEIMTNDLVRLRDVDNRMRKKSFEELDEKYGFNYAN